MHDIIENFLHVQMIVEKMCPYGHKETKHGLCVDHCCNLRVDILHLSGIDAFAQLTSDFPCCFTDVVDGGSGYYERMSVIGLNIIQKYGRYFFGRLFPDVVNTWYLRNVLHNFGKFDNNIICDIWTMRRVDRVSDAVAYLNYAASLPLKLPCLLNNDRSAVKYTKSLIAYSCLLRNTISAEHEWLDKVLLGLTKESEAILPRSLHRDVDENLKYLLHLPLEHGSDQNRTNVDLLRLLTPTIAETCASLIGLDDALILEAVSDRIMDAIDADSYTCMSYRGIGEKYLKEVARKLIASEVALNLRNEMEKSQTNNRREDDKYDPERLLNSSVVERGVNDFMSERVLGAFGAFYLDLGLPMAIKKSRSPTLSDLKDAVLALIGISISARNDQSVRHAVVNLKASRAALERRIANNLGSSPNVRIIAEGGYNENEELFQDEYNTWFENRGIINHEGLKKFKNNTRGLRTNWDSPLSRNAISNRPHTSNIQNRNAKANHSPNTRPQSVSPSRYSPFLVSENVKNSYADKMLRLDNPSRYFPYANSPYGNISPRRRNASKLNNPGVFFDRANLLTNGNKNLNSLGGGIDENGWLLHLADSIRKSQKILNGELIIEEELDPMTPVELKRRVAWVDRPIFETYKARFISYLTRLRSSIALPSSAKKMTMAANKQHMMGGYSASPSVSPNGHLSQGKLAKKKNFAALNDLNLRSGPGPAAFVGDYGAYVLEKEKLGIAARAAAANGGLFAGGKPGTKLVGVASTDHAEHETSLQANGVDEHGMPFLSTFMKRIIEKGTNAAGRIMQDGEDKVRIMLGLSPNKKAQKALTWQVGGAHDVEWWRHNPGGWLWKEVALMLPLNEVRSAAKADEAQWIEFPDIEYDTQNLMSHIFKNWKEKGGWSPDFMSPPNVASCLPPGASLSSMMSSWILFDRVFVTHMGHVFLSRGQGDMPKLLNGYKIVFTSASGNSPRLVASPGVAPPAVKAAEQNSIDKARKVNLPEPSVDAIPVWGIILDRTGHAELVRLGNAKRSREWAQLMRDSIERKMKDLSQKWKENKFCDKYAPACCKSCGWTCSKLGNNSDDFNHQSGSDDKNNICCKNCGGSVDFGNPGIDIEMPKIDGMQFDLEGPGMFVLNGEEGIEASGGGKTKTYFPVYTTGLLGSNTSEGLLFGCPIPLGRDLDEHAIEILDEIDRAGGRMNVALASPELIPGWRVILESNPSRAALKADPKANEIAMKSLADLNDGLDLKMLPGLGVDIRSFIVSQLIRPDIKDGNDDAFYRPIAVFRNVRRQPCGLVNTPLNILQAGPTLPKSPDKYKPFISSNFEEVPFHRQQQFDFNGAQENSGFEYQSNESFRQYNPSNHVEQSTNRHHSNSEKNMNLIVDNSHIINNNSNNNNSSKLFSDVGRSVRLARSETMSSSKWSQPTQPVMHERSYAALKHDTENNVYYYDTNLSKKSVSNDSQLHLSPDRFLLSAMRRYGDGQEDNSSFPGYEYEHSNYSNNNKYRSNSAPVNANQHQNVRVNNEESWFYSNV